MHDMPGYALTCGWCTAGKWPCPVCRHRLEFLWLNSGKKYVAFDTNRKFLKRRHPFREDKKNFKKLRTEHEVVEVPKFDGKAVDDELRALVPAAPGSAHQFEGYGVTHNWTHVAALTKLEYYKDLKIPHNIDVMHTEKNVGESILRWSQS